jgi:DNA polymerase III alpha subunit
MDILPIFRSHFSIGKSILTLESPDHVKKDGPDSIFSCLKEANLNRLFLVDDNMVGFLDAFKYCDKNGIQLIFGVRMEINEDATRTKTESTMDRFGHKIYVVAKNSEGIKDLIKLFSFSQSREEKSITSSELKEKWSQNLQLVIPFYDSFLFNNTLYFSSCIFDIDKNFGEPYFLIEDNELTFDGLVRKRVEDFCAKNNYQTVFAKTILYKNREDVETLLTLKIINGRSFGRQSSLDEPNIDDFSSHEFCFESYLEKAAK